MKAPTAIVAEDEPVLRAELVEMLAPGMNLLLSLMARVDLFQRTGMEPPKLSS